MPISSGITEGYVGGWRHASKFKEAVGGVSSLLRNCNEQGPSRQSCGKVGHVDTVHGAKVSQGQGTDDIYANCLLAGEKK